MKISITCEKKGWIYYRFAEEIQKRLTKHQVLINEAVTDADINYFIDFGYYRRKSRTIDAGWFTHFPNFHADQWMRAAREFDRCVVPSEWTKNTLIRQGVAEEKIAVVTHCADARFVPKIRLGIIGRPSWRGTRGERLVKALTEDTDVNEMLSIVAKHPGWGVPVNNLNYNDFYNSIDFLLVPALSSDEPLPYVEALACGKKAITPRVGDGIDFDRIEYDADNFQSLKGVVVEACAPIYEERRRTSVQVKKYDWAYFAAEHEKIFIELHEDFRKKRGAGKVTVPEGQNRFKNASVEELKQELIAMEERVRQMEASLERMRNMFVYKVSVKTRKIFRKLLGRDE